MKSNWPLKKLGEVVDFQNGLWKGKRPPFIKVSVIRNTNFRNNGTLDFENIAEIEVEEKQLFDKLLKKGDIVLERSGGGPTQPVGRVVYFDKKVGDFSFSNFTTRIRIKDSKQIDSVYIWRFLHYFYISGKTERMQRQTTGIRNLNFSEYKDLGVPVPPLTEQKRTVKKLEKILAKIEEAKRIRQKSSSETAQILKITLNKTFNGKKLNSKNKLYQVAKRIGGGTPSRSKREYFEGNIPWFTVTDLPENDGRLITIATPRQFITEDAVKHSATKLIPKGSVLLATRVGVGKVAIAGTDVTTNQDFSSFIPHNGLDNRFLGYFLLSQKHYFDQNSRGITIKGITTGVIDNMELSLPSLEEQGKIVVYLDGLSEKVQTLQKLQQEQLQELEALQQSVFHQAFQGE